MKSEEEIFQAAGELEELARTLQRRMGEERHRAYPTWLRLRQVEAALRALRWVVGGEGRLLEVEEPRDGPR